MSRSFLRLLLSRTTPRCPWQSTLIYIYIYLILIYSNLLYLDPQSDLRRAVLPGPPLLFSTSGQALSCHGMGRAYLPEVVLTAIDQTPDLD